MLKILGATLYKFSHTSDQAHGICASLLTNPPQKNWDWLKSPCLYVMYKVLFVCERPRVHYFTVNIAVVRNVAECTVPKFQRYSCHHREDVKCHHQTLFFVPH
jgi:hypothetical protein